jgi:hypothetical protein
MEKPLWRRSRLLVWFAGSLLAICAAMALYTWATLHIAYSRGERVGVLQKFSQRGWVCKTWEGEVAMVTEAGLVPEKFYFSTSSDPIAAQVNGVLGKRVRLKYAQHKGVPLSCFGDTEFFVDEAQPVE